MRDDVGDLGGAGATGLQLRLGAVDKGHAVAATEARSELEAEVRGDGRAGKRCVDRALAGPAARRSGC
jgi:hypothetical protein